MQQIKIRNNVISKNSPVFIIAEAGVNHNGSIKIAKKLVDAAVKSGADAVKFQTYNTEKLIRKDAPKAKYQNKNIGERKTQHQMLKELELSQTQTIEVKKYCEKKNIIFFSTSYDFDSFKFLKKINVPLYKLASIDIVFHPMIKKIAQTGKPLILSTGMATEKEVADAAKIFKASSKKNNLILLQCNTNYPSNPEDQNLLAMEVLQKYTPIVGFSDHVESHEASIAAVALGAQVLEKHLTLNKKLSGPDHSSSANPTEFKKFVESIRKTSSMIGKKRKSPTGGERENIIGMRRSICANHDLPKGKIIQESDLAYKRPGNGLAPTEKNIKKLLGKRVKIGIKKDENLSFDKMI